MSDQIPFLSVYGHVAVDQIDYVDRFPEINETVDVMKSSLSLGGTGANIAVNAARLGVPTALCAFTGSDFPDGFRHILEDSGLMLDEFNTVEGMASSGALLINDRELRQKVLFNQGPQGSASKLGKMQISNAKRSKKVHFCTGDPQYYLSIMHKLKDGPDLAVDPAQEIYRFWKKPILDEALIMCKSLFCNEYEASVITKRLRLNTVFDVPCETVVMTKGAEGSRAKIGNEMFDIPCLPADTVVDATGAGDSYRAGYYAGLYYGFTPDRALIIASSVASFTVEKVGAVAATPTWEDVMARADRYL